LWSGDERQLMVNRPYEVLLDAFTGPGELVAWSISHTRNGCKLMGWGQFVISQE
jgi:hypothetical protein